MHVECCFPLESRQPISVKFCKIRCSGLGTYKDSLLCLNVDHQGSFSSDRHMGPKPQIVMVSNVHSLLYFPLPTFILVVTCLTFMRAFVANIGSRGHSSSIWSLSSFTVFSIKEWLKSNHSLETLNFYNRSKFRNEVLLALLKSKS